jgi:hypothetical protein
MARSQLAQILADDIDFVGTDDDTPQFDAEIEERAGEERSVRIRNLPGQDFVPDD